MQTYIAIVNIHTTKIISLSMHTYTSPVFIHICKHNSRQSITIVTYVYCKFRICDAVSEYYMGQFVDHWKRKTKQESSTIKVVAALLVEKLNHL